MHRLFLFVIPLILVAQEPRMNQIQTLGSHNSYKQAIDGPLLKILRETMGDRLSGLEYSHLPMTEQLDRGMRSLEIDVVYDPEGGRYATPLGLKLQKERGLTASYDPEGVMRKPGFKVLHVPDIDFRSHAYTFRQALEQLRGWSQAHPRHLPIVITMNAKSASIERPDFVPLLPFDRKAFLEWDTEIRAVLPAGKLITPGDVQGKYATLETAVLAHAWPTLEAARGRFLFVLDEAGEKLETYRKIQGHVMFVPVEEGNPDAAFLIVNEPKKNISRIQYLVRSGYLVRTRADADTREARSKDYTRWKAALESGAQVISTDYYQADPALGTGYQVSLPGGEAGRWNGLLLPALRPLPRLE